MMHRLLLFVACLHFLTHRASAQSVLRTIDRLPDTGQQTGYTAVPGEDNDFFIHPPGFVDNLDGTVTDTVTGLQWQKTDGGEMTFLSARAYADTLVLGGYSDWRLPAPLEAFSILNLGRANPALDTLYFTRTPAEYWWTDLIQFNDTGKVWVTNAGGGIGNHPVTETISAGGTKRFHTRVVRDRTTPQVLPARYTVNGDGTVTDQLTSLVWMQSAYTDSLSWESALQYTDTLQFAGADDWRMPNMRELQSIAAYDRANPSLDLSVFPGLTSGKFWSSTTLPNQPLKAWYFDTRFGITTYADKSSRLLLVCVRGDGSFPAAITTPVQQRAWSAYPNPAGDILTITGVSGVTRIRVVNGLGQEVAEWTGPGRFSVGDWPAGCYVLYPEQEGFAPERIIKY